MTLESKIGKISKVKYECDEKEKTLSDIQRELTIGEKLIIKEMWGALEHIKIKRVIL